jgi:hypothetical protein
LRPQTPLPFLADAEVGRILEMAAVPSFRSVLARSEFDTTGHRALGTGRFPDDLAALRGSDQSKPLILFPNDSNFGAQKLLEAHF